MLCRTYYPSSAQILFQWLQVTAQIDPQERPAHPNKWLCPYPVLGHHCASPCWGRLLHSRARRECNQEWTWPLVKLQGTPRGHLLLKIHNSLIHLQQLWLCQKTSFPLLHCSLLLFSHLLHLMGKDLAVVRWSTREARVKLQRERSSVTSLHTV